MLSKIIAISHCHVHFSIMTSPIGVLFETFFCKTFCVTPSYFVASFVIYFINFLYLKDKILFIVLISSNDFVCSLSLFLNLIAEKFSMDTACWGLAEHVNTYVINLHAFLSDFNSNISRSIKFELSGIIISHKFSMSEMTFCFDSGN